MIMSAMPTDKYFCSVYLYELDGFKIRGKRMENFRNGSRNAVQLMPAERKTGLDRLHRIHFKLLKVILAGL